MLTTDGNHLFAGKESGQVERCNAQISLKGHSKLQARLAKGLAKQRNAAKKTNACETAGKMEDADSKIDAGTIAAADEKEDQDVSEAVEGIGDNKNGAQQGMHNLAAALVASGELELAKALFLRLFCMADELPCLAANGLLVEINFVRDLIRRELERAGASSLLDASA